MAVAWTEEQQKVITLRGRNILVSAAAGSGKTAVLVERIIRMLTDGTDPIDVDQLLVVTFTEAAAAEMKDRIREAIEKKLALHPENEHLKQQATFIHNAQITTIHSFCLSVIRDHFPALDIDPGFRIGEEGELKLLQHDVLEEMLEEKYQEKDPRFLKFASSYGTGKNDKRIEELILKIYEYARSYPDSEEWLISCEERYNLKDERDFQNSCFVRFAYENCGRYLEDAEKLLYLGLDICREPDGPFVYEKMLEADLEVLETLRSAGNYQELSEKIQHAGWMRMPVNRDKTVSEEKISQVKYLRTEVKNIVSDLKKQYFFQELWQMFEGCSRCYPMVQELTGLVRLFSRAFEKKKREKNLIDFSDMEHYALQILTEKTEEGFVPSRIAREYQEQFYEVMIDEYQDSNLIQEAVLSSVSRESRGEYNRFMVGDVKQSIYRFRLSRPELFLEKFKTYGMEDGLKQRIDLHKNFRSRGEVLDLVNAVFCQIMTPSLGGIDYDEKAALYQGAAYPENTGLEMEVLVIEAEEDSSDKQDTPRELEARAIAGRIRKLRDSFQVTDKKTGELRRARYSDMVILTRSIKGYADVITEVLNREGIPAFAGTREGYFSTQEIAVILDYLRVLNNRKQDIPLTAVLSSPIAGCCAKDLAVIRAEYPDMPFYDAVPSYAAKGNDREIRRKLGRFFEVLDGLREKVPYTPMHELLVDMLEKTGYGDYAAAMPGGEQRKANIEMLVEKAKVFESTSYKGLFHFVRYMEQLQKYDVDYGEASVEDEQSDTVRVMTIHKSKGLEFPIVFVAGLGKQFNQQDARSQIVLHGELGIGIDAVDPDRRTRTASLAKKVIQKEEALETLGEELRILYVALTRAKEKLILSGTMKQQAKKMEQYSLIRMQKEKTFTFGRLSKAVGYWDWLIPAILRLEGRLPLTLSVVTAQMLAEDEAKEKVKSRISNILLEQWDDSRVYDPDAKEYFRTQFTYQYPYPSGKNRKMKYTVSELKKMSRMDENTEEETGEILYEEPEVIPLLPKFLTKPQEELKGALRGTAFHRFMELLDFTKEYRTSQELEEALADFTSQGRIAEDEANAVSIPDIRKFLQCSCGQRMQRAAGQGKLWKEQPFVLGLKASDMSGKEDQGRQKENNAAGPEEDWILVQGIIDVYFEEEDGLVLLDYKTDRIFQAQQLKARYQPQLKYYAKALEQITGKKVKECWIYSFTLGEEITV